jgi:hypothetical protein
MGGKLVQESIDQYLTTILRPQLDSFGVINDFTERIISTVREQVYSCVYHWNDKEFRKSLLLIGSEEGINYLPAAAPDIRNFVVVTIRNSEIESLQSKNCAVAGLAQELDDVDVKKITASAIEHFSKVDFVALQKKMEPPVSDKYYDLSLKYPVSWCALTKLAAMKAQIVDYKRITHNANNTLDELSIKQEIAKIGNSITSSSISVAIIDDGFALSIDPQLMSVLKYSVTNEQPFLVDSFKCLTRNIKKLLAITEYLLCNGSAFVTSNYYLSNGHTERRLKLLKAGRSYDDGFRNWTETAGLGTRHKSKVYSGYC